MILPRCFLLVSLGKQLRLLLPSLRTALPKGWESNATLQNPIKKMLPKSKGEWGVGGRWPASEGH